MTEAVYIHRMGGLKDSAEQSKMEVTTQPLAAGTALSPVRNVDRNRSTPMRGVTRNRSGPIQRGVARNRSGPMRGVTRNKSGGPRRGVNRTTSRTKALPLKTNSFQRSVPDRASSTSSLRKYRRQQNGAPILESDDNDISVASTQTMDSIMVRKKQIGGVPNVAEMRGKRWDESSVASSTVDLDAGSLHTVDSMAFHQRHLDEGGPADDMSAFSESFISSSTYLSDYEEGYELGDDLPESDQRVDIEMNNLKIGEPDNSNSREDEDEEDDLEDGGLID